MRNFLQKLMPSPILCQMIEGCGTPKAEQGMVMDSPADTSLLAGSTNHSGGTATLSFWTLIGQLWGGHCKTQDHQWEPDRAQKDANSN